MSRFGLGAQLPPSRAPMKVIVSSTVRSIGGVLLLVLIYFTLPFEGRLGAVPLVLLGFGLALFGVTVYWQVRGIFRADYPLIRAVEGFAWAIPAFLIIFAIVYFEMSLYTPGSFSSRLSRLDSLYFTVTTFTTVGFGDITPITKTARSIVTVQMTIDIVALGLVAKTLLGAVGRTKDDAP